MEEIQDYHQEKLTIDLVKANLFAVFLMIPVFITFALPYYLLHFDESTMIHFKYFVDNIFSRFGFLGLPIFIILVTALGIIAHELIHGVVWAKFAKNGFKSIKFGVLWKMLTPYCHCKEPLLIKHYILGAIMPAIILGVLPAIYSIISGNFGLLLFGGFLTIAAAGDFMIIYLLRKEKSNDLVQDHPSEGGCFVYRKE
ncbi:DUF3267 domain-containing protein [Autumnicola edwardsiae]|uniref:DUF3267 domain-containing protein n=1 Tax=Autumnicola edwardsiae TaxID=3075594 RepID=A0ABU3CZQ8_9FLAO|nr:DUF3267 domain-containing protein [Zunongwangia sp. F297]MDT0651854.1 DUF3267 domain-containing protein [Zunongwangia sp. F297]